MKLPRKTNKSQPVGGEIFGSKSLPQFGRPAFADTLRFPADITSLDARNISELLGKYTAMYSFVNEQQGKISGKLLNLQTVESLLRNKMLRDAPSLNNLERWRRDTVLDADPAIETLFEQQQILKGQRDHAGVFLGNYERCITALSRELSRKMQDSGMR